MWPPYAHNVNPSVRARSRKVPQEIAHPSLGEEEWKRYRQQLDTAEQHLAVALVASSSHRERHARESRE